ncbi:hypothetical protein [Ktedonospora formicarum]|uniref:hypothetical protein n=1 Tax=Ktedonospora formicarum TaxID=2778364 RepID=UPI001C69003F|nr:hypothetical protein [Ktedonospora formicarum]
MDHNLTTVILPQLSQALASTHGRILMTNAYTPFQNLCPLTTAYIAILNQHLARDIQGFGTLVDVFTAFEGVVTPNSQLCTLTWMHSAQHDIHPTSDGYKRIADALTVAYRRR